MNPVVTVRRRFLRSVHLERDFYAPGATDGYAPTLVALATLRRIVAGVRTPAARAFSLTGAYGSGKSAFALVLAKSLCAAPWGDADLRQASSTKPAFTARMKAARGRSAHRTPTVIRHYPPFGTLSNRSCSAARQTLRRDRSPRCGTFCAVRRSASARELSRCYCARRYCITPTRYCSTKTVRL